MEIIKYLDEFGKTLGEDNRFAYLALTSKIEIPFRDHFAYYLHNNIYNGKKLVAREYTNEDKTIERADLVVLDNGKPEIIIEFKACYSYYFRPINNENSSNLNKINEYLLKMVLDYMKHDKKNKVPNDNKYYILLVTVPETTNGSDELDLDELNNIMSKSPLKEFKKIKKDKNYFNGNIFGNDSKVKECIDNTINEMKGKMYNLNEKLEILLKKKKKNNIETLNFNGVPIKLEEIFNIYIGNIFNVNCRLICLVFKNKK